MARSRTVLRMPLYFAAGTCALAAYVACSATDEPETFSDASSGSGGALSSSTSSGGGTNLDFDGGGVGGLADGQVCAAEVHHGELLPLDMYVMLDQSYCPNLIRIDQAW